MHIISRKAIQDFCKRHSTASESFEIWYRIVKNSEFKSFQDIRSLFPSADKVKNLVVFNIGGNNYRLVAFVAYKLKRLYIRHVLTHREYDDDKWKEDAWYKNTKK